MTRDAQDPHDAVEYRPETGTYRVTFSEESEPPSTVLIEAIETIADQDFHEFDPLYTALEPNALDELFRSTRTRPRPTEGRVQFTYQGYEVTVRSAGVVEIRPTAGADESRDRA